MQSAPIAEDGRDAGEAVDPKWEGQHGHAHAAARYGVLSRPAPSPIPELTLTQEDWVRVQQTELLRRYEERWNGADWSTRGFDGRPRYLEV